MKRIVLAALVLFVGIMTCSVLADAKPNTVTAAEAVGLPRIAVSEPALTESLPERTTLDPSALATKPPKIRKDDVVPIAPPSGPKKSETPEGQQKAK